MLKKSYPSRFTPVFGLGVWGTRGQIRDRKFKAVLLSGKKIIKGGGGGGYILELGQNSKPCVIIIIAQWHSA